MFKWFFNVWYKYFPPEVANYKQWTEQGTRARVGFDKEGGLQMEIQGEKYPIAGMPRQHILFGPLAELKHKVKNMVFNQVFAEIEKMAENQKHNMLPFEKMAPAVKELYRGLEKLENAEVVPDMKARIALIRKVICFFLQEDDAYRFRFQWLMENMDINKVKLSDADRYWFRAKYFKVDHKKYDY